MTPQFATEGLTLLPRRRERRWVHRVVLFAVVVLLVDALFGDHGLRASLEARHRYERGLAELQGIRGENALLSGRMRRLTHDPRAIEAEARRELGLIAPGEVLFVVRRH
jgi:cell division protein FtsB